MCLVFCLLLLPFYTELYLKFSSITTMVFYPKFYISHLSGYFLILFEESEELYSGLDYYLSMSPVIFLNASCYLALLTFAHHTCACVCVLPKEGCSFIGFLFYMLIEGMSQLFGYFFPKFDILLCDALLFFIIFLILYLS